MRNSRRQGRAGTLSTLDTSAIWGFLVGFVAVDAVCGRAVGRVVPWLLDQPKPRGIAAGAVYLIVWLFALVSWILLINLVPLMIAVTRNYEFCAGDGWAHNLSGISLVSSVIGMCTFGFLAKAARRAAKKRKKTK